MEGDGARRVMVAAEVGIFVYFDFAGGEVVVVVEGVDDQAVGRSGMVERRLELGVGDGCGNGLLSEIETVMKSGSEIGSKIYRAYDVCCGYDRDHDGDDGGSCGFEIVNVIGYGLVNVSGNGCPSYCRRSIVLSVGGLLGHGFVMCPVPHHVRCPAPMLVVLSLMRLSSFAASVCRRIYSIRNNSLLSRYRHRRHPQCPIHRPHPVLQACHQSQD